MREDEKKEGECRPEPADLDKVDVENIGLLCEVAGSQEGIVGLGMRDVWRVATAWLKGAEQGAEDEGNRIDGE